MKMLATHVSLLTFVQLLIYIALTIEIWQGLTKTGDDYEVKAAHVELAERMRKVGLLHWLD